MDEGGAIFFGLLFNHMALSLLALTAVFGSVWHARTAGQASWGFPTHGLVEAKRW